MPALSRPNAQMGRSDTAALMRQELLLTASPTPVVFSIIVSSIVFSN